MTTTAHAPLTGGEQLLQLSIPLVLPGVEEERDGCVARLQERLHGQTGIKEAHVAQEVGKPPALCLHYDPNLVPLEQVERLAMEAGAEIVGRYKHETLPVQGMDCGSCAASIEHVVSKLPGILRVSVNYAVEKMKVEYDSTLINHDAIVKAVKPLGYKVLGPGQRPEAVAGKKHDHDHDHDHDHAEGDGHDHGAATGGNWITQNPELALSLLSGILLGIGFFGAQFFSLPEPVAIGLYAVAYIAGGWDLTRHGLPAALRGRFDVDFLMILAAIGAAVLGEWAEGALLLFLFSFGHALEHFAMERARNAIQALGKITPRTARVRRDGAEQEIPVEELRVGDVAIIRNGERVAVDGTITEGNSALDQSPITGESVPVEKKVGDAVFAGAINGDGSLVVEVTKLAKDTTMARVIQMVEEAQAQKSPTQRFSENFERLFVPSVLGVVVLAAIVPPLLGWLPWKTAVLRALSTLVAASPCALALATPSAVLAGIAQAARNGVLIKGGAHLENLGSLRAIAMDKTGTITKGRPEVTDVITAEGVTETELLQIAAAIEAKSSHPLAQAVVRRAEADSIRDLPQAGELQTVQGRGVTSTIGSEQIRIGNLALFEEAKIPVPEAIAEAYRTLGEEGKPTMVVGRGDHILGVLGVADQLRPETPATLKELKAIGIESLILLTGDNARVARNIASQAGLTEVRADLLPEDKVTQVQALLKEHGQVAMIGDGVNDAPALANATVGIAMGAGGTAVALETADVALMGDDLTRLPYAVALSRQSRQIIQQNLSISLGVIVLLVPSTLFGWANIGWAVLFHECSTLVVVGNALRLLNFRR